MANGVEVLGFLREEARTVAGRSGAAIAVEEVYQGKMSFLAQVSKMHGAGLIIGIHGADLTNCVFLPRGSVLIEINPWYTRGS